MRWLVGFVFVLALATLRVAGCGDESPCGNCDDGNPCTMDNCVSNELGGLCESPVPSCRNQPVTDGTPCGSDEVCVHGVCGENLCEGVVCEDDDACTDDTCDYVDATCEFPPTWCEDGNGCTQNQCDPQDGCNFPPVADGAPCLVDPSFPTAGTCVAGTCVPPCDPASEEILQCPRQYLEDQFCCPGNEYCMDDCSNGS